MASSTVRGPLTILSAAVKPSGRNCASAPSATLPASATTGTPAAFALRATPAMTLPRAVWPSIRPSPVSTRSLVAGEPGERAATGRKLIVRGIEQAKAQRLRHARATVIGRAAPNADQKFAAACVQCVPHQFPGPKRGGVERIDLLRA